MWSVRLCVGLFRTTKRTARIASKVASPFVFLCVVFIALELWHPHNTMSNTMVVFAFGAIILAYLMRRLIPLMLARAITFTLLYFGLFLWGGFSPCIQNSSSDTTTYLIIIGIYIRACRLKSFCLPERAKTEAERRQCRQGCQYRHALGRTGHSLYERTTIRPALTFNGLSGGYEVTVMLEREIA